MSRIDFKGTGEIAQVNDVNAAMALFEYCDIPYHYITKGENAGKIRVKALRDRDHEIYFEVCSIFREIGCEELCEHNNIFRDVDDSTVITFSPYHLPCEEVEGRKVYKIPQMIGYNIEVVPWSIYGHGTMTVVVMTAW